MSSASNLNVERLACLEDQANVVRMQVKASDEKLAQINQDLDKIHANQNVIIGYLQKFEKVFTVLQEAFSSMGKLDKFDKIVQPGANAEPQTLAGHSVNNNKNVHENAPSMSILESNVAERKDLEKSVGGFGHFARPKSVAKELAFNRPAEELKSQEESGGSVNNLVQSQSDVGTESQEVSAAPVVTQGEMRGFDAFTKSHSPSTQSCDVSVGTGVESVEKISPKTVDDVTQNSSAPQSEKEPDLTFEQEVDELSDMKQQRGVESVKSVAHVGLENSKVDRLVEDACSETNSHSDCKEVVFDNVKVLENISGTTRPIGKCTLVVQQADGKFKFEFELVGKRINVWLLSPEDVTITSSQKAMAICQCYDGEDCQKKRIFGLAFKKSADAEALKAFVYSEP